MKGRPSSAVGGIYLVACGISVGAWGLELQVKKDKEKKEEEGWKDGRMEESREKGSVKRRTKREPKVCMNKKKLGDA